MPDRPSGNPPCRAGVTRRDATLRRFAAFPSPGSTGRNGHDGVGGGTGVPPGHAVDRGRRTSRRLIALARSEARAGRLARATVALAPGLRVVLLPACDCLPYDRASPSRQVMGLRMAALRAAPSDQPRRTIAEDRRWRYGTSAPG